MGIENIRKTSTFESFVPPNEDTMLLVAGLEQLANDLTINIKNNGGFDHSRLINLYGKPGTGKSHLLEAFVSQIISKGGYEMTEKILFLNDKDVGTWRYGLYNERRVKIVTVDDLFANNKSVNEISSFDLKGFMDCIYRGYETKQFIFVTSNFSLSGITEIIAKQDGPGRITSRLKEMTLSSIKLDGPDYREIIAAKRIDKGPFAF